jgi:hypothetical protein
MEGVVMAKKRFPREFRPVLQYVMRDGRPLEDKVLNNKLWDESGVVYVRIVNGEPVYIGSTNGKLSTRLKAHLQGIGKPRSSHATKYREFVEGKTVTIYAYKPEQMKVLRREISVHRGLEAALIEEFNPEYTKRK